MLPFGGQGANMAMLGALDLVNLLFDLESDTQEEITSVFERYHRSRRTASKAAFNTSHQTANLMHGKVGRRSSFSDSLSLCRRMYTNTPICQLNVGHYGGRAPVHFAQLDPQLDDQMGLGQVQRVSSSGCVPALCTIARIVQVQDKQAVTQGRITIQYPNKHLID
jgi:hypothetical protein